ncbi:MAG TPA: diguanylate cyclase [Ilumatobacteraceae bacterium]|nr:diguanylate cyclase [Ilumatobacteraceae bacterium]
MTARTTPGATASVKSSRHGRMSAHWNRAFAVLLGLSLTTAALSIVVVQQIESTFVAATDEVSRETASYDRIVSALTRESAAAHLVLDVGSPMIAGFLAADEAVGVAMADALATYDEQPELDFVSTARSQWDTAYISVRELAGDADAADAFAADTSPRGDIAHGELAQKTDAISVTAQALDQVSRRALEEHLDDARATKTKLLILLGAIFALSVGATVMYARRMARDVVRPIRTLWESADRFGAGQFDHRVELHNDDEIGELAERFNVMADTIASTHLHLRVQAHHDALTSLVNRAGFMERLDAAVDPTDPEAGSVSVMFIDLDDFKHVNDDLGHAAGDELLRQVADRLRGAARSTDVVCRLGGDEFAILIGSPAGRAVDVADRILRVLEQPFTVHGALIRIGASIGIASQRTAADSGDYLLRAADVAMYAAKGQGKHRWQYFNAHVHGPIVDIASSILGDLETSDRDPSHTG